MTSPTTGVTGSTAIQNYLNQQSQQVAAQQSAAASAAASSSSSLAQATSATTIGSNFNTFINILTTQLKSQDPTNATDPNQFTQELVQFAGVEQQLNTNNDLQSLINLQTNSSVASSIGYIGNYVEAPSPSNQMELQNGKTEFGFTLANAANNVNVTITDSSGKTVASFAGSGAAGANIMSWNGTESDGTQATDGIYTFNVTAADSSGNNITVSSPVALTQVTAVQSTSSGVQLTCGGMQIPSSSVTAVYTAGSLPTAQALGVTPSS